MERGVCVRCPWPAVPAFVSCPFEDDAERGSRSNRWAAWSESPFSRPRKIRELCLAFCAQGKPSRASRGWGVRQLLAPSSLPNVTGHQLPSNGGGAQEEEAASGFAAQRALPESLQRLRTAAGGRTHTPLGTAGDVLSVASPRLARPPGLLVALLPVALVILAFCVCRGRGPDAPGIPSAHRSV